MSKHLRAIEELQNNLTANQLAYQDSLSGRISQKMGIAGSVSLPMAARSMAMLSPDTLLGSIGGMGLGASMLLRAGQSQLGNIKNISEIQAIRDTSRNTRGYSLYDLTAMGLRGTNQASKGIGNIRNIALTLGALGVPGMHGLGTAAWAGSNLFRGPLAAATSLGGLLLPGNSITNAMSLWGGLGAAGLSGLGHAAGGLASMAGLDTISNLLPGANDSILEAGVSAAKMGLVGGAGGTAAAMAMGLPTMMLAGKLKRGLQNFVDNRSEGIQLMRGGARGAMMPQLISSSEAEQHYGMRTKNLDRSLRTAMQQRGSMEPIDYIANMINIISLYLSDIASSNSLLRGIFEYVQEGSGTARGKASANITQNRMQQTLGYFGTEEEDYTSQGNDLSYADINKERYENIETPSYKRWKNNGSLLGDINNPEWWGAVKWKAGEKLYQAAETASIYGSIFDIGAWMQGGEQSFLGKLDARRRGNVSEEVKNKVSKITMVPRAFLELLESTSVKISNVGETVHDKILAVNMGMYDLLRFIGFRVQDIAHHLGADKNTMMGLVAEGTEAANALTDQREPRGMIDHLKESFATGGKLTTLGTIGAAIYAGGAIGLGGGISSLLGMGLLGYNAYKVYKERNKAEEKGKLLTAEQATEEAFNGFDYDTTPEIIEANESPTLTPELEIENIIRTLNIIEDDALHIGVTSFDIYTIIERELPKLTEIEDSTTTAALTLIDIYDLLKAKPNAEKTNKENKTNAIKIIGAGVSADDLQQELKQQDLEDKERQKRWGAYTSLVEIRDMMEELVKCVDCNKETAVIAANEESGGLGGLLAAAAGGGAWLLNKAKGLKHMTRFKMGGGILGIGLSIAQAFGLTDALGIQEGGYISNAIGAAGWGLMALPILGPIGAGALTAGLFLSNSWDLIKSDVNKGISTIKSWFGFGDETTESDPSVSKLTQAEFEQAAFDDLYKDELLKFPDEPVMLNPEMASINFNTIEESSTSAKMSPIILKQSPKTDSNPVPIEITQVDADNINPNITHTIKVMPNIIKRTEEESIRNNIERYLEIKSRDIQNLSPQSDPNKVDTEEEMTALLKALWADNQTIGSATVEHQAALREAIYELINVVAGSNAALRRDLSQQATQIVPVASSPTLGGY